MLSTTFIYLKTETKNLHDMFNKRETQNLLSYITMQERQQGSTVWSETKM